EEGAHRATVRQRRDRQEIVALPGGDLGERPVASEAVEEVDLEVVDLFAQARLGAELQGEGAGVGDELAGEIDTQGDLLVLGETAGGTLGLVECILQRIVEGGRAAEQRMA